MSDLLQFPSDDDIAIEPELAIEPDGELQIEPEGTAAPSAAPAAIALAEVLPADFRLPALIQFVPNPALRRAADEAATYALSLDVAQMGADGLQRADVALSAVRASLLAIDRHLEDPIGIANGLHKRLTGVRGEWRARGDEALKTVGQRIYAEQRRLEALAAEERRKAQAEADKQARDAARREAEEAAKAQAPAAVVEELQRQAETATAPPVAPRPAAPPLRGSTTVETWKARIIGTSGSDEPNPSIETLSGPQRTHVLSLLRAILDGKAPVAAIEINWPYLNKRAKADKSALAIPGIEAFTEGGVRAKSTRAK